MSTLKMGFRPLVIVLIGIFSIPACGGGKDEQPAAPKTEQRADTAKSKAAAKKEIPRVDACMLISKAEIEKLTGKSVLEPVEEKAAELSICSYGDPGSPMVGGRPLSKVAVLSVFTGGNAYYAGPVAQAAAIFEMAEKNSGGVERVSGIGERAHWAGKTLRAVRGPYMIEVEVDVEKDSRKIAEQLAKTMLDRISQ
jgi:hypothetical protein